MKKLCISFLGCAIIVLSAIGLTLGGNVTHTEYLRIHVRANSNSQIDQAVKLKVKDAVVEFLTPYLAECDTKVKAEKTLKNNLGGIEAVADKTLKRNGFNYTARASVKNEEFPTRAYGDLVLDGGFYDALILELGSGEGDNWWCVCYPPLCFTDGGSGYVYKSKILEIINDFMKKR